MGRKRTFGRRSRERPHPPQSGPEGDRPLPAKSGRSAPRPCRTLEAPPATPKTGRSFSKPGDDRFRPIADIRRAAKTCVVMQRDEWSFKLAALALAANEMLLAPPAEAQPVRSRTAACDLAERRAASRGYFNSGVVVGSCEIIRAGDIPTAYYVLTLHSTRRCDYICSSLLGHFAVRRSTGQVFEWNVGEWRLGPEIGPRRRSRF